MTFHNDEFENLFASRERIETDKNHRNLTKSFLH